MGKFNLDIYFFAKNFYVDALEWGEIFDILFLKMSDDKWIKNQYNIPFSKTKIITIWLLALEAILKCMYIQDKCESYDVSTIKKIYKDMRSKKWHKIIEIYDSLSKDWKELNDEEVQILQLYSDYWISIRYSLDAFYLSDADVRFHLWDVYVNDEKYANIIKKLDFNVSDLNIQEKIKDEAIKEKFHDIEKINNMLTNFSLLFIKLKDLYDKKSWAIEFYQSLIKDWNINGDDKKILYDFIFWFSSVVIPKANHDIIYEAIKKQK